MAFRKIIKTGDPDDIRMLQGSSEFCTKLLYGSIGVGVTLEIGDVAGIRPFAGQ